MNDKILLTISILISDRLDTVEKCLQSLDSLRKNVPCELILTDTGCGEKVRAIVEKYADVVLEFEWCRDFAKARNLGLDAARGEWFLYLDDDEWFEDTKEIEEFFVSGLYKKYAAALYLQRNYTNSVGTMHSDVPVSRIVRLDKGVRFQYSIHETFQNMQAPYKLLRSYVHHYGYIFKNNYERYMHSQRNVIPLLMEHENDPQNLRHNAQLAQEYNAIGEHNKSIEISLQGIDDFCEKKSPIRHLNSLFVNIVERYMRMYQYENVISYGMKYLDDKRLHRRGTAKIYLLMLEAAFELGKYKDCVKYCDIYLKIYDDYVIREDWYTGQGGLFLNDCFEKQNFNEALCYGIAGNIEIKDYNNAEKIFKRIDLENSVLVLNVVLLRSVINAFIMEEMTEEHPCIYMINQLLSKEKLHKKMIELFEELRKTKRDILTNNYAKWKYLQGECWYIYYLNLNVKCADKSIRKYSFKKLWEYPNDVLLKSLDLGVWELATQAKIDMGELVEEIPFYKWKTAVLYCCATLEMKDLSQLDEKFKGVFKGEGRQKMCWDLCFLKRKLDIVEENADEEEIVNNLTRFSELSIELAKEIYREDVLISQTELLPADIQLAICVEKVNICIAEMRYLQAIKILRKMKDLCPSFSIPIKLYIRFIEKKLEQQENEKQADVEEMQRLERTIKVKIQDFIQNRQFTIALQLISQLESIIGENEELEVWKNLCNSNY